MTSERLQPRGVTSTLVIALLLGACGGLLWIGRIRLAFIFVVALALITLAMVGVMLMGPPLPGFLFGNAAWVYVLVFWLAQIMVVLFLRTRSHPHPTYSRLWFIVVIAIVAVYLPQSALRMLGFQNFSIPSGSMMPTLLVGDHVSTDKRAYGYSRFSFPFGIYPASGRIYGRPPERGDIVIFKHPGDPSVDYIMRTIGLPGDTVQMRNGRVVLNGVELEQQRLQDFKSNGNTARPVEMYREILPSGRSYAVLNVLNESASDNTGMFVVPEGHIFLLGDNRDNSNDSRYGVGFVPFENLVGRAVRVYTNSRGNLLRDRQDLTVR